MNTLKALKILNIDTNETKILKKECVRKAYLKASLKYHPDKYHDNGEKFKEINEAYTYLCNNNKINVEETNSSFEKIMEEFISKFSQNQNWDILFIKTTMANIFLKCENYILNIFEHLEKDKAMEVYEFLTDLHFFTDWNDDYLDKLKIIIQKKMKYDNIVLLNPTLDDLLEDNVFKLEIQEKVFYIPLWYNELYFDMLDESGNKVDLIVKINQKLKMICLLIIIT